MDKIKQLIKKYLTKEVIFYIIFGILTTIVNIVSFHIMANIFHWEENISNLIAIVLAVLTAYITNKDMVFHSQAESARQKLTEFIKFIAGRTFTTILELVGGFILFKLPIPNIISKAFITAVVIILNFFISKFFTFKRKEIN